MRHKLSLGVVGAAVLLQSAALVAGGWAVVTVENPPAAERTQLQFSTPGGTRLIWVFDADFDLPVGAR